MCFRKFSLVMTMLLLSLCSFAQEIRYMQTGYIDKYGVRQSPNSSMAAMVQKLTYSGQYASYVIPAVSPITIRYKLHHYDGGNAVYYQAANDMLNGREHLNENSLLVVSSDKRLINIINYFQGQRTYTIIYERNDGDSYGTMAR